MQYWLSIALLAVSAVSAVGQAQSAKMPQVSVKLADHPVRLELALTQGHRQLGMMHRKELDDDSAMLFVFDETRELCFWMKDTLVPLDLAYLSDAGIIEEILPLDPLDLTSQCSKGEHRLALEVARGWFERRSVAEGEKLKGLPPLLRPLLRRSR